MSTTLPSAYSTTTKQALASGGTETEVFVSSILTLDNQTISIADFGQEGSVGYLVIDPLSTQNYEIISFTGVDATGIGFTGITRGLSLKGDGASLVANKKYHGVGTTVTISWGAPDLQQFMDLSSNQTVTGAKTFSSQVTLPNTDNASGHQALSFNQANSILSGGSGTASPTTFGTVKITTSNQTVVSTDDTRVPPTGSILMYGGAAAPTGWLICDGSSLLRAGTYAALFSAIGTGFGSADGTHFNIPDMRGRVAVGVGTGTGGGASGSASAPTGGNALTARALGDWVGEETHALSTGELAAHTHTITGQAHTHTIPGLGNAQGTNSGVAAWGNSGSAGNITSSSSGGPSATDSNGSGTGHNNLQPLIAIQHIIKI